MSIVESLAYRISGKSRERKYRQFLDACAPSKDDSILDVGANVTEYSDTDNILEKRYPYPGRITAVAMGDTAPLVNRYPNIRVISGDGTALPFADSEFDIVYSNAVIEHVGGREQQLRFLRELVRVGRRGYLTTPNRYFPVEIHTRVPLLHLILSKSAFDAFVRFIGKGWATGDYMHLLSRHDLTELFSKSGMKRPIIVPNRFFGFTMTYTVIWNKE